VIIGGIDYSMTSPAVCVFNGEGDFHIDKCKFMFVSQNKKKFEGFSYNKKQIISHISKDWVNNTFRFIHLAGHTVDFLNDNKCVDVALEDYAFAARGMVFTIGENGGILKFSLALEVIDWVTYTPSQLKKFAVGKGNANKFAMLEAFVKETGWKLDEILDLKITEKMIPAPITDLVDAYWICKQYYTEKRKSHGDKHGSV